MTNLLCLASASQQVRGHKIAANAERLRPTDKKSGGLVMTEAATQFALSSIGQISINVHDVKKATDFYRDTLGMKFLFEAGHMAFFDCGGVRLMLSTPDKPEFDHPSSFIYYRVADIQRSYEILLSRGVVFDEAPTFVARMQDHDLWMAFFRDPDNNPLVLMSEPPRAD
jgi:methylmalonyl-CoA/ethylmalonyl-CoA epimerase